MPPTRTRDDLHKKAARALLRAAFINGCRFRFHRYTSIDEQCKGFVLGQRKTLAIAIAGANTLIVMGVAIAFAII